MRKALAAGALLGLLAGCGGHTAAPSGAGKVAATHFVAALLNGNTAAARALLDPKGASACCGYVQAWTTRTRAGDYSVTGPTRATGSTYRFPYRGAGHSYGKKVAAGAGTRVLFCDTETGHLVVTTKYVDGHWRVESFDAPDENTDSNWHAGATTCPG